MGSIRPSNIKRISEELVDNNKDLFNEDFNHNKEILHSFIEKTVTKKTANAIAGYIPDIYLRKNPRKRTNLNSSGLHK